VQLPLLVTAASVEVVWQQQQQQKQLLDNSAQQQQRVHVLSSVTSGERSVQCALLPVVLYLTVMNQQDVSVFQCTNSSA
jgi:hypothetical protein